MPHNLSLDADRLKTEPSRYPFRCAPKRKTSIKNERMEIYDIFLIKDFSKPFFAKYSQCTKERKNK